MAAGYYGHTPRSSKPPVPRRSLHLSSRDNSQSNDLVPHDSVVSSETAMVLEQKFTEMMTKIGNEFKDIKGPLNKLQHKVDNIESELDLLKKRCDEGGAFGSVTKSKRLSKVLTVCIIIT